MNIKELDNDYYKHDRNAVLDWCANAYRDMFSIYFDTMTDLYNRLNSTDRPITDQELETILIDIPLDLMQASEKLTMCKTSYEAIKLSLKKKRSDLTEALKYAGDPEYKTSAAIKQAVDTRTIEDELLLLAYQSLITRVEGQISFSRELIMGAKKVFDRRKANEEVMPVKPVSSSGDDLPEYSIPGNYIKG